MDAITAFYREHGQDLYRYAQRISYEHADDLVQELFLSLCERSAQHKEVTLSRPYVFRSLRNSLCDLLRKSPVTSHTPFDAYPDHRESLEINEGSYYSQCLDRALEFVKPTHRTVLSLWIKDELSLHEISERLGMRYQQVKLKKHRGLQQLKKKLVFILQEQH